MGCVKTQLGIEALIAASPPKQMVSMMIPIIGTIIINMRESLQKFARLGLLESHAKTINIMMFTIGMHWRIKKINQSPIVTVGLRLAPAPCCTIICGAGT